MEGTLYRPGLISVIIAAFNSERTIERTLASVLSQAGVCLEVIVVDDGSTDRTSELVEQMARRDNRVRLIRQQNGGISAARNRGVQESTGEWIAPLDGDDIYYAGNLQQQLLCGQAGGDRVAVVYSWSIDIDSDDRALTRVSASSIQGDVFLTLLCHNFLGNASCTLIRRSVFDQVGGYDANMTPLEDWDLYLRIAQSHHFMPVKRFLIGYRQSGSNVSRNTEGMARAHAALLAGVRRRNPKVPAWLCRLSQSNLFIYIAGRHAERREFDAMRGWLRRAAAYKLSLLRPDWWMLLVVARRNSGTVVGGSPDASNSPWTRARSIPKVIVSAMLHGAMDQLARIYSLKVPG